MAQNLLDEIKSIEQRVGKLSSAQKILLTTDGSVTAILDVLKDNVNITTLIQEFVPADVEMARHVQVDEGKTVNYRVVTINSGTEPLIYAISVVPLNRLNEDIREDMIRADTPIGRILKNHDIESRREIKSVFMEDADQNVKEIFKTDSPFLSRTYDIIYRGEILIWLKEMFPCNMFVD